MNWFILSLSGSILHSFVGIFQKIGLKDKESDPVAFASYYQFLLALFILPLVVIGGVNFPLNPIVWFWTGVSVSFLTAAGFMLFRAIKVTEISQVIIFNSTRPIWIFVGGIILFKEQLTLLKFLGIFLITGALLLIYWKRDGIKFGYPHLLALGQAAAVSVAALCDRYLINFYSPPLYQFITTFSPAVLMLFLKPSAIPKLKSFIKLNRRHLLILLAALFFTGASLLILYAYKSGGEVSRVYPIYQTSALLTVLLGIILLGEKENWRRKLIGIIIAISGVLLIKI